MSTGKFRVIIAGGGCVGLALGIMFVKSDIDFVILERHPTIVSDSGASITLWPHGARIFDSLGLLERSEGNYLQLRNKATLNAVGSLRCDIPLFEWLEEHHGYPCMAFPRPRLMRMLYDALGPEHQSKVRTGAAVEDIEILNDGVRVRLSDGSVETGSIVVGADGIHSVTRTIMERLAVSGQAQAQAQQQDSAAEGSNDTEEEDGGGLLTTFQCLYGTIWPAPSHLNIPEAVFYEMHSAGRTTQLVRWEGGVHFGMFKRLPKPTRERRTFFTAEETETYESEFADFHMAPEVKAGELMAFAKEQQQKQQHHQHHPQQEQDEPERKGHRPFPPRGTWTRLVQQPEGFAARWQLGGRIALVGDAALQLTSAAGLGYNAGLQSAVLLANLLGAALTDNPSPGVRTLEGVLAEYEGVRRAESELVADLSARMMRGNVWESWGAWFTTEWLIPWVLGDRNVIASAGRNMVSYGRVLDRGRKLEKGGSIPWAD